MDMDTLGYFIFMDEQEKKQKAQQADDLTMLRPEDYGESALEKPENES